MTAPLASQPARDQRKDTLSITFLTAANAVPLAGVLFFGWDAAAIMLIYWTENLIVGFYNILKMACLKMKRPVEHLGKLVVIFFFCFHFGGFCAAHGLFLLILIMAGNGTESLPFTEMLNAAVTRFWQSGPVGMVWAFLGLLVSHGVSFAQNYLAGKEYASLTIHQVMLQPYSRIILMHVAIVAGGAPVMMLGSPIPLLIILVAFKIGIDIWLHNKSHRAARTGKGE